MFSLRRLITVWIWVFLVFLALFLLSTNFGRKRSWNPAAQLIIEITAPFQNFIKKTIFVTTATWLKYFELINVRNENERLIKQNKLLKMENDRFRELIKTTNRLQGLLQFKENIHRPVLAVQVIGRDPTGWFKSVIINKGKRAGLEVNMPVVNAEGVIGRLVAVSPNYAKVLLIIDQNSAVDSIIQRSRETGIVKGLSSKICKLEFVVKSGDVVPGDMVITSGLGGVFPKGLPVGKVVQVNRAPGELFQDITIKPKVDFSKLEELLVILKGASPSSELAKEAS
ncbi:MAG: rod shape-determining protein MreC [Deltaproteobacteria bacterium]|nr:rod shape-determining protein MreC [Deltaproteobacteria bacterium]